MAVKSVWVTEEFIKKVKEKVRLRLIVLGSVLEGEAIMRCVVGKYPEGSGRVGGRLRGSITFATETKTSMVRAEGNPPAQAADGLQKIDEDMTVRIGTNVDYAIYVELGLSGNEANKGFLRSSIEENKERIIKFMEL